LKKVKFDFFLPKLVVKQHDGIYIRCITNTLHDTEPSPLQFCCDLKTSYSHNYK